jgi:hypothetical protein
MYSDASGRHDKQRKLEEEENLNILRSLVGVRTGNLYVG